MASYIVLRYDSMKKHLNSKKIIILVFTPVLVALMVVGFIFGIQYKIKERNTSVNQPKTDNTLYSYAQIYLADSDNVLLPLTIKYKQPDSQAEELMYILSMLKKDSAVSSKEFNGLLPTDTKVNGMTLENEVLNINFDNSFATYDAKDELRLIESLTWTFTDLPYVSKVTLSMEDTLLKNMPVNKTPLNNPLTKDVGINNLLLTSTIMGTGERVLSYYEKKINNQFYYVPVTHYVSNKNNLSIYDLTIATLFKEPGITSSLQVCRCISETEMMTSSVLTDNILYVSLSDDILFDELTVSYDVYKIIKEVTALLEDVKDVSFLMDLEEVRVNGIEDDEEIAVSKIELNKYYI